MAGISFVEAPLKFRAPGVTVRIGLGIGRLVFKAVNTIEAALALVIIGCVIIGVLTGGAPPSPTVVALAGAVVALAAQLIFVRPRLTRRSNAVLAGEDTPRSRAHHAYVVLETAKLLALLIGGITALALA